MNYLDGQLDSIISANELESEIQELKNTKQDTLVDGYTIKKINNQSIMGEGNLSLFTITDKTTYIELVVDGVTYKLAKYTEENN